MNLHIQVEVGSETDIPSVRLNVAGLLDGDGAKLLKKTCKNITAKDINSHIEINMEEVSFVGEDAARLLCGLNREPHIRIIRSSFLTLEMMKCIEAK